MTLLKLTVAGVVRFGLVFLDTILAFLVLRLLSRRLSWPILEAFDRIGSPLVSQVNQAVGRRIEGILGKSLSEAHLTAVSVLALLTIRVAVVLLFSALPAS